MSRFFRVRRNRRLCAAIGALHAAKHGPVDVLDVGGSLMFWLTIPAATRAQCRVRLLNLPDAYLPDISAEEAALKSEIELLTGDARDLSQFADDAFDLVVCNSVIEHVGSWADMRRAATEARRVGRHGWVQVPAFEFPVEQHYLLPFVHWFADPVQHSILVRAHGHFRRGSVDDRRMALHHMRPLTRTQLRELFPDTALRSEWVVLPKSHIATW